MRAHRILEALDKVPSELNFRTSKLIKESQKFAFDPGSISDEISDGANDFARDLMKNGVFPLPYDVTLFEIGPHGLGPEGYSIDIFTWCLVWRERDVDRDVLLMRAFSSFSGQGVFVSPVLAEVEIRSPTSEGWWGYFNVIGLDDPSVEAYRKGAAKAQFNPQMQQRMHGYAASLGVSMEAVDVDSLFVKAIAEAVNGEIAPAIETWTKVLEIGFNNMLTAVGLMSTRGTTLVASRAPKFMNKARIKKGKHPLFEYKTLAIDPQLLRIPGSGLNGDRAAPRLHWRRGHVRSLRSGAKTMVRPCIVGDKSNGVILKDYVIDVSNNICMQPDDNVIAFVRPSDQDSTS